MLNIDKRRIRINCALNIAMPERTKKNSKPLRPASIIALSFLIIIIVGAVLFTLPFMTRDGKGLSFFTGLFTATSSVCVTGLTLIDPAVTLTRWGQILLVLLIEIGGISMVTFGSFFIFTLKKRSGLRSMRLAQEYTNVDTFSQVKPLVRVIIATSVICQSIGALLLGFRFVPKYGAKGIWISIFTAVSAYCNAGFDLFGIEKEFGSLINYNGDPYVMLVIMALIVTGGIGFFVFYDIINYRKTHHLSLHTKVVLLFTAILIGVGFISIFAFEFDNEATLNPMNPGEKIIAALFQSITARTAGFASIDLASMHDVTEIIMMIFSVIKNRDETVIMGKRVDRKIISKSLTISFLGLFCVFVTACLILIDLPNASGIDVFFEAVSAFATVGVTVGITSAVGSIGLCALIAAMFIGRIGPICVIIALNIREAKKSGEILPEGRIMVG